MGKAALSTDRPGMAKHKIHQMRREAVESFIEQLIALLDDLDGDPDLEDGHDAEPSVLSPARMINGKLENDLEDDTSDSELSLGWSIPDGLRIHVPEEARQIMYGHDMEF